MSTPTLNITVDQGMNWCAKQWLAYNQVPAERQKEIVLVTKYNLLVKAFNTSTWLIVAAATFAIFMHFAAAATFALIGLGIRSITQGELLKFTVPVPAPGVEAGAVRTKAKEVWGKLRTAFKASSSSDTEEQKKNVFDNIRMSFDPRWVRVKAAFNDWPILLNAIDVPPTTVH